jgi:hypothetical protein
MSGSYRRQTFFAINSSRRLADDRLGTPPEPIQARTQQHPR